ncbi:MAG: N-acetyltransferase [Chloroflexota bacterium]
MLKIRSETLEDIIAIRQVNAQAFGREIEAKLVEKLRMNDALTISLVAVLDGEIVGHIAFSLVTIEHEDSSFKAVTLAPIAVLPSHQNKGIGSKLVKAGLKECQHLGYEIVVLVGHPNYYPRFGFVPAKPLGLECEFEVPDEPWMVLELRKDALTGRRGTVKFRAEFREFV